MPMTRVMTMYEWSWSSAHKVTATRDHADLGIVKGQEFQATGFYFTPAPENAPMFCIILNGTMRYANGSIFEGQEPIKPDLAKLDLCMTCAVSQDKRFRSFPAIRPVERCPGCNRKHRPRTARSLGCPVNTVITIEPRPMTPREYHALNALFERLARASANLWAKRFEMAENRMVEN
jgi:hypothetical protein